MKMLTSDQNRARRDHINLHKTMKCALTIIIVLTAHYSLKPVTESRKNR